MELTEIVREISSWRAKTASALPVLSLNQSGVKRFKTAGIATRLVKEADNNVKSGTKIYVTGNDGPNLNPVLYKKIWISALSDWLDRGASITYFLVSPNPIAIEQLLNLAKAKHKGTLQVFTVKKSSYIPARIKHLLDYWETTHFVVFEKPWQFWLEGSHPKDKVHADLCFFFSKEVAEKSALPLQYKQQLELVLQRHGKLLSIAPDRAKKKAVLRAA